MLVDSSGQITLPERKETMGAFFKSYYYEQLKSCVTAVTNCNFFSKQQGKKGPAEC